jgi:ribonuclease P/MRP protein subunit RPP40
LNWIQNFLKDRTHQTRIGSARSHSIDLHSGAVQGSVIRPLFFLLYINDIIATLITAKDCHLYADDFKLYTILNTNVNDFNLQKRLDDLKNWSDVWQLRISYKKCAVLPINYTLNEPLAYSMLALGENELSTVDDVKDLGIIIDNKLKFTLHINRTIA